MPLRGFMQRNVREKDLKLFMDLSKEPPPATPEDLSLRILVPAFMISEQRGAFRYETNNLNDLGGYCFPIFGSGKRLGSGNRSQDIDAVKFGTTENPRTRFRGMGHDNPRNKSPHTDCR